MWLLLKVYSELQKAKLKAIKNKTSRKGRGYLSGRGLARTSKTLDAILTLLSK